MHLVLPMMFFPENIGDPVRNRNISNSVFYSILSTKKWKLYIKRWITSRLVRVKTGEFMVTRCEQIPFNVNLYKDYSLLGSSCDGENTFVLCCHSDWPIKKYQNQSFKLINRFTAELHANGQLGPTHL